MLPVPSVHVSGFSSNSFTRVVAVGNPHGFEYADEAEQEIAKRSSLLIRNCTIC